MRNFMTVSATGVVAALAFNSLRVPAYVTEPELLLLLGILLSTVALSVRRLQKSRAIASRS
jgi:hypothetical protein